MLEMALFVLRKEGLCLGGSSAINLVAACRTAKRMGPDPSRVVVTFACDSGTKYLSRMYNPEYVSKYDVKWPEADCVPNCLR